MAFTVADITAASIFGILAAICFVVILIDLLAKGPLEKELTHFISLGGVLFFCLCLLICRDNIAANKEIEKLLKKKPELQAPQEPELEEGELITVDEYIKNLNQNPFAINDTIH